MHASPMAPSDLEDIRRSRRHPRREQFDYLHLVRLLDGLRQALPAVAPPGGKVLDIYCGSRPYDDLFAPGTQVTGLDVTNRYGVADVVTDEFLPFPDAAFDGVTCIEAFHYAEDPEQAVAEIRRVLKPGGGVVIPIPFTWEYDPTILEHRYTGPELQRLFADWDDVRVVENGDRVVAWSLVTGAMLARFEEAARRKYRSRAVPAGFAATYRALNGIAGAMERLDQRIPADATLPANIMLTARKPA